MWILLSQVNKKNAKGRRVLTLDMEWASDDVLKYCEDLLLEFDIPCTIFVTHNTPWTTQNKISPQTEWGWHPNFNSLLQGDSKFTNAKEVLQTLNDFLPGVKSLRSHSMTASGILMPLFKEFGIEYLSHYYMPGQKGILPIPQSLDLLEVPVYFADDGWLASSDQERKIYHDEKLNFATDKNGVQVFNFHPLQIALNSPDLAFYQKHKSLSQNWTDIKKHRHSGKGIETLLRSLLTAPSPKRADDD